MNSWIRKFGLTIVVVVFVCAMLAFAGSSCISSFRDFQKMYDNRNSNAISQFSQRLENARISILEIEIKTKTIKYTFLVNGESLAEGICALTESKTDVVGCQVTSTTFR
jgi:hypothetical protein